PTVTINPPGGPAGHEVYYKITATDHTDNESDSSNVVSCNVPGNDPHKIISRDFSADVLDYELDQNYPNPFNPTTSIKYQLKEKGFVSLRVYDMIGKEVAVLVNETQVEGQHSVIFNAANLPSGVYIYSLRVNGFVQNNKMILLK
ncbi:MAG: T9SS type A sorting domain-containing protein, partial [Ignavibacteriaceae bacterium]|nr:T9SS type A sorting domain-containing protein [Ignavibacteriaceae bacterium]